MNVFNRETIAPSFARCNRTPSSREHLARELANALAGCTIKPTVVPGFTGVAPRPARRATVDPETRLIRKKYGIAPGIARDIQRARDEQEKIDRMVKELEGVR